MRTSINFAFFLLILGSLSLLDINYAFGQLEEIVVTARKREESLQNVPMAIQAFDSSQIARFAATDLSELADMANQVIINESGVGLGANIRIRSGAWGRARWIPASSQVSW